MVDISLHHATLGQLDFRLTLPAGRRSSSEKAMLWASGHQAGNGDDACHATTILPVI
jgi:hypothetical protein